MRGQRMAHPWHSPTQRTESSRLMQIRGWILNVNGRMFDDLRLHRPRSVHMHELFPWWARLRDANQRFCD